MITKVISGGIHKANGIDKIYIGRGSVFGNPFKIGIDGNREEVIKKFESYFYNNEFLKNEALKLKGKVLVCHCKPLSCHGDVIVYFLEGSLPKQRVLL